MRALALLVFIAMTSAAPAQAVCFYRGKLYAKTRLDEEFRDAKWVVRARVKTGDYHWSDVGPSWTVYGLRVVTLYKGPRSDRLRLFTMRDSGGFYLDEGLVPDFDHDYLLFLSPPSETLARRVVDAVQVNYECGQSRRWSDVSATDRSKLAYLSSVRR